MTQCKGVPCTFFDGDSECSACLASTPVRQTPRDEKRELDHEVLEWVKHAHHLDGCRRRYYGRSGCDCGKHEITCALEQRLAADSNV